MFFLGLECPPRFASKKRGGGSMEQMTYSTYSGPAAWTVHFCNPSRMIRFSRFGLKILLRS